MPVLKAYADASGHYIHASIRGGIITMQVSPEGVQRLFSVGVKVGERFGLHLLADLTRENLAYTRLNNPNIYEAEQFEFAFDGEENSESEALFPACAVHGSFEDLHLTTHLADHQLVCLLLSPAAMDEVSHPFRLSIPLSILSLNALDVLENGGHLPANCAVIESLKRWYRDEKSTDWEQMRRRWQGDVQQSFPLDSDNELVLV